ncbi:TPA: hypothetical protein ACPZRY_004615 [Yersinia enterocolitica]|uniref:hypothetical protein n=1 Tax=Yersinia enterocolitica TaxID=630 RepID=UPI0032F92CD3|nr:hypothetical protein [Yersinia enterocolitica]HDL7329721.1 hypothetical protein [Yersinia enterocolitica]HDL7355850.1 hypothetical protein [Yersinia enterocolitica]
MSKSTTLEQLNQRWYEQKCVKHNRAFNAAGRPGKERFAQLFHAHARRINRQHRLINRASRVAGDLTYLCTWSQIIRSNRKLSGYPVCIHIFGNSGTPKGKRRDE